MVLNRHGLKKASAIKIGKTEAGKKHVVWFLHFCFLFKSVALTRHIGLPIKTLHCKLCVSAKRLP